MNIKRCLATTGFALLSCTINAQIQTTARDYTYYNQAIDSLILAYSVDEFNEGGGKYFFTHEDEHLNTKEKKKLIDKIRKMFEQKDYTNLYYLGHNLIFNLYVYQNWYRKNTLEIRQVLMELYLQYYFYPGINTFNSSLVKNNHLESKSDYTKKAKQRIVEILEDKKTEEEYELYLKYIKSLPLAYKQMSWEDAARIMKKREIQNNDVLKQIRDSLLTDYINRDAKQDFESLCIEPELIKMIGLLDMKECIPILKRDLDSCILKLQGPQNNEYYWFPRVKAYRDALVCLGDKKQRQYMLENLMNIGEFSREDFAYFKDDEMIWRYIEVNYFSKNIIHLFSEGEGNPASLMTMNNVYPYIKNLPKELKHTDYVQDDQYENKWADILYKWLIANKTTVAFDYEGKKEWPW
ncbi:hypothetical protein FACS189463_2360 [Bacteroidia bacterium]|nr:hypothetical protein FACS189463_2360 [Bacteroidia bacterium]